MGCRQDLARGSLFVAGFVTGFDASLEAVRSRPSVRREPVQKGSLLARQAPGPAGLELGHDPVELPAVDRVQVLQPDAPPALDPEVIVPGHGPLCGIEGAIEMKAYLQYVRDESRKCFDNGLPSLAAAKRIEFGPYGEWRAPARRTRECDRSLVKS